MAGYKGRRVLKHGFILGFDHPFRLEANSLAPYSLPQILNWQLASDLVVSSHEMASNTHTLDTQIELYKKMLQLVWMLPPDRTTLGAVRTSGMRIFFEVNSSTPIDAQTAHVPHYIYERWHPGLRLATRLLQRAQPS